MNSQKLERVKNISVGPSETLLSALRKMDEQHYAKLLLVTENDIIKGLLSIGDVQRAIIHNIPLETPVSEVLRKEFLYAGEGDAFEDIRQQMVKLRTEFMPVLDKDRRLTDIYFWDEVFKEEKRAKGKIDAVPAVIMAGGKGTRLKPITNVLPKPLIPVGDKTILEHILDNFVEVGCPNFLMTVNYKADLIEHYFNSLDHADYNIRYFREDKFLGTAGSLYMLQDILRSTFFVSNCDIIIDADYSEIYHFHKSNNYDITIVGVIKHFQIPYGVLETNENGLLSKVDEKPGYTFKINSGMYILEPATLKHVPENDFFHITDLIEEVVKSGGRVGVYPINEGSWMDIGEWKEYNKTAQKLGFSEINFG